MNLNVNADEGVYAQAVGSVQLLTNGNLSCNSGAISGGTTGVQTIENDHSDKIVYVQQWEAHAYRSFRMRSLYTAVTP